MGLVVPKMKDNMERTLQVETLPQLPLRGLVLYPQEILHFDVGRNRSLCALNQAMAQDQRIFLTAQKDVQTDLLRKQTCSLWE